MSATCIITRGVSKLYTTRSGRNLVLEDINLTIACGERIALVGPNGSGKTTLLRIILGIEHSDAGSVSLPGLNSAHRISYVPQDYRNALFPWLRLHSNLSLGGEKPVSNSSEGETFLSSEDCDTYHKLSDAFRLSVDLTKYPYQLSGGEQQIFLLVRAILTRSALMVLDEPLSAVDFGRKRLIQAHLGRCMATSGTTLIFASHDFEEAVLLADRVVVLARESARLKTIINVDLPWPRGPETRQAPEFRSYVEAIIGMLT